MKGEALFQAALKKAAPFFKCSVEEIPDSKMLNAQNRYWNKEKRRPFDVILITPSFNYCCELKYQNNGLKNHQEITQNRINKINNSYFVLRKKITKREGTIYTIEQPEKNVLLRTDELNRIIEFFVNLKR